MQRIDKSNINEYVETSDAMDSTQEQTERRNHPLQTALSSKPSIDSPTAFTNISLLIKNLEVL